MTSLHHDHDQHRWKSISNLVQLLLNIFLHRKWLLFPIFVLVFLFFYTFATVSGPNSTNRFALQSVILTESNINEYTVKQINQNKSIENERGERDNFEDSSEYLISTENCKLKRWPLFDWQTKELYENIPPNKSYDCSGENSERPVTILRENRTWIRWTISDQAAPWNCYAREMKFNGDNDGLDYGPELGPLPRLSNFDSDFMSNISDKTLSSDKVERQKWDAVKVRCNRSESGKEISYSRVIPLVQNYQIRDKPRFKAPNVLMLGMDSVSRLNFHRHFHQTKHFIEQQGFIPLLGHHKVGENTFPNMMPIFTGHPHTHYWNESIGDKLKFDNIPLIFYEYQRKGYVTTFIEDMPPYGIFTYKRGGFRKQPTDYYLRPVNVAIWPSLYNDYVCYQGEIEYEIYYQFLLELFDLFREHGSPPHLTIAQWSTLTHNHLNKAGYCDLESVIRDLNTRFRILLTWMQHFAAEHQYYDYSDLDATLCSRAPVLGFKNVY